LSSCIVFTFIGNDKPGLVEMISQTVARHGANWLESRMSQLAGKFAGIIRVSVGNEDLAELITALNALSQQGLSVVVEQSEDIVNPIALNTLRLTIVGLDRPGIVREVSQALSKHQINVLDMSSSLTSAAMSGEALFNAEAVIQIPDSVDIDELEEQLEDIANELTVDITLDK
jgi:glycine cleavage system regulatory protein